MVDPEDIEIEPSWWEDPLGESSGDAYSAPELLYFELAKAAALEGDPVRADVLKALTLAASGTLEPSNWTEPFVPAWTSGSQRSPLPSDLSTDQLDILARVAPLIRRDDLRARVADVAWVYGDRADSEMRDRAVDAYRSAPLDADCWFDVGRSAWVRAFEFLARSGEAAIPRAREMSAELTSQIMDCTIDDRFRTVGLAEILRIHGGVEESDRTAVRNVLLDLAARCAGSDCRLSRHMEREAIAWFDTGDTTSRNAANVRIAETYIAEADRRVEVDPRGGALVEGFFLEKAIAILRALPRSYRSDHGLDDRIDALRVRLSDSRELSLEYMMRIQSDPIDLTPVCQGEVRHLV